MSNDGAFENFQPAQNMQDNQLHVNMADPQNSILKPADSSASQANGKLDYLEFGNAFNQSGNGRSHDKLTPSSDSSTAYTDASIKALQSTDPTLAAALQAAEPNMSASGFSKFESNAVKLEQNDGPGGSKAVRDADDLSLLQDAKKGLGATDDAAASRAINAALAADGNNLVSTFGTTFGFFPGGASSGSKSETNAGSSRR